MEELKIQLFEIQSTRAECFGIAGELELLFKDLEAGKIPEDLYNFKARTISRLKDRGNRMLLLEKAPRV